MKIVEIGKGAKYDYSKKIKSHVVGNTRYDIYVDIYDVTTAFNPDNKALDHAIKKMLKPGTRGTKSKIKDIREAGDSIERAIEIEQGRYIDKPPALFIEDLPIIISGCVIVFTLACFGAFLI